MILLINITVTIAIHAQMAKVNIAELVTGKLFQKSSVQRELGVLLTLIITVTGSITVSPRKTTSNPSILKSSPHSL